MLLSIIVPVYNVESYLLECLNSIKKQEIDSKEIILINDGSTDNSLKILTKFKEENQGLKIKLINQKNQGLSNTRNLGLKKSKGKYIYFIDSDDFLLNNISLKNLLKRIEEEKADIIRGEYQNYYNKEKQEEKYNNEELILSGREYLLKKISEKNKITVVWNSIYNREFLFDNKLEFYSDILHEDDEFNFRVTYLAKKIIETKELFYNYRQREGSIMNNNNISLEKQEKKIQSMIKINKNLLEFLFKNNETNDYLYKDATSYLYMVFSLMNEYNLSRKDRDRFFSKLREIKKLNLELLNNEKINLNKKDKRKIKGIFNSPKIYFFKRYFFRKKGEVI